ncbi:hypothetical protein HY572_00700 [Candidatus Micrarchaeota archaeon]|nr:hypothetical protein [Candidatus Micrarchaeota archaeon]
MKRRIERQMKRAGRTPPPFYRRWFSSLTQGARDALAALGARLRRLKERNKAAQRVEPQVEPERSSVSSGAQIPPEPTPEMPQKSPAFGMASADPVGRDLRSFFHLRPDDVFSMHDLERERMMHGLDEMPYQLRQRTGTSVRILSVMRGLDGGSEDHQLSMVLARAMHRAEFKFKKNTAERLHDFFIRHPRAINEELDLHPESRRLYGEVAALRRGLAVRLGLVQAERAVVSEGEPVRLPFSEETLAHFGRIGVDPDVISHILAHGFSVQGRGVFGASHFKKNFVFNNVRNKVGRKVVDSRPYAQAYAAAWSWLTRTSVVWVRKRGGREVSINPRPDTLVDSHARHTAALIGEYFRGKDGGDSSA